MRTPLPREFYIPKGSVKIVDKASTAVAYVKENPDSEHMRFVMVAFNGKAQKPALHYSYRATNRALMERRIKEFFESCQKSEAFKASLVAERRAYVNDWNIGEIVATSWGYEQTNVDYFEVIGVKGMMVELRAVARSFKENGWASGHSRPVPGEFVGPAFKVRAQKGSLKIDGQYASRCRFEMVTGVKVYAPHYESSYA